MIKILIAEDQRMLLSALGSLLDLEEDMQVIRQVVNGKDALESVLKMEPDLCLMDIEMPVYSGLEVAERLNHLGHPCKILILTTFARPGYFERAVKAGVHGYLLKDSEIDEMAIAIRKIVSGEKVYSPELMLTTLQEENPLTEREQEVLKLAATGMTTKEITKELFLSHGTVRNYISEIIQKLEAKNRIEAIRKAEESGWI